MKPIEFKDQNTVIAKNQPPYIPLPAHITQDNMIVSCWGLTIGERLRVLFTGVVWSSVMTFGTPLQPQKLTVFNPFDLARKLLARALAAAQSRANTTSENPTSDAPL